MRRLGGQQAGKRQGEIEKLEHPITLPQPPRLGQGVATREPKAAISKRVHAMPSARTTRGDQVVLPAAPALVAGPGDAAWLTVDGEVEIVSHPEAARRATGEAPLLCHARATARRLGLAGFPAFDLLELYAFVRPARFCVPTPRGLAAVARLACAAGARWRSANPGRGRSVLIGRVIAFGRWRRSSDRARHGQRWLGLGRRGRCRARLRNDQPIPFRAGAMAQTRGMVGIRARAAGWQHPRRGGRSAPSARRNPGRRRRASPATIGLRRGGERRLSPARPARRSARCSGGSRHRRRQDARLYRAGQPVGRKERRCGMDFDLHAQPPASDRLRARPAVPRPGGKDPPRCDAQGARELSLPAQLRGQCRGSADAPPRRGGARAPSALDRRDARRRHGGRRSSRLAARIGGPRANLGARRPARRMHPFRLPALSSLLHREKRAARPARAHRRCQPCAGDDPGGARRARR